MVLAIVVFLTTTVVINLYNVEPRVSLNSQVTTLISDIKNQQLYAMTGGTDNNTLSDFGVYFANDRYTLFKGSSYILGKTDNSVITLPENIIISGALIPGSIIFGRLDGEIINFPASAYSFSITNTTTNGVKNISFNKLGVVTAVNP